VGETVPNAPEFDANLLLRDFLQERWKGLTPILWGQQLKQERLDELIYLNLLNVDHLPNDGESSPLSDFYRHNPQPTASKAEANDA
jgi:glycerol-3-phosphate dehydrogenase